MSESKPPTPLSAEERARLKLKITIVGFALIAMGASVLFLVHQLPLPVRISVGIVDVIVGMALLLFLRPKFE